jgi:hypothetical protein
LFVVLLSKKQYKFQPTARYNDTSLTKTLRAKRAFDKVFNSALFVHLFSEFLVDNHNYKTGLQSYSTQNNKKEVGAVANLFF